MALRFTGGTKRALTSINLASTTAHSFVVRALVTTNTGAQSDFIELDTNAGGGTGIALVAAAGGATAALYVNEQDGSGVDQYLAFPSVTLSSWHHYAVTFDGSVWRTYVDGALVDTSAPGSIAGRAAWNHAHIGNGLDFTAQDVAIFSRQLSGSEVALLNTYRQTTSMLSGCYAWLPMFTGTENNDNTGSGHNLAAGATPASDAPGVQLGSLTTTPTSQNPRRFAGMGRRGLR